MKFKVITAKQVTMLGTRYPRDTEFSVKVRGDGFVQERTFEFYLDGTLIGRLPISRIDEGEFNIVDSALPLLSRK